MAKKPGLSSAITRTGDNTRAAVSRGAGGAFRPLLVFMLVVLALAFAARPAHAEFGIAGFDQQIAADSAGTAYSQAGGHPYEITTEVQFNTHAYPLPG